MTRSFLIAAVIALASSGAWAQNPQWSGSPGSNGVDNVGAAVSTMAPAPASKPSASTETTTHMAIQSDASFNPSLYRTTTDCLNAAAWAHAPLAACAGRPK